MLEENWNAVQVFIRCRQDYATSMAGAFALGFTAREIESGCRLAAVAADEWPDVSEQVLHMGGVAAGALNERQGK